MNTLAEMLSVFRTPVCQPWLRSLYPGFGFALCSFGEGFGAGEHTVLMANLTLERGWNGAENGGGGGSRTRVRNRSQPGEFMLCPLPFGFAADTQNGQDAPSASPIGLALAARTEPPLPAYCMTSALSP